MAKYKICSSMKNKNLVSNIVQVEKIKSKGGIKRKHKPMFTRDLLIEFMGKQREFNKTIVNRLDRVIKLNNLKE